MWSWTANPRRFLVFAAEPMEMNVAQILVVDDNPMIRTVIRSALEDAGHDVTTAASGERALQAVAGDSAFDMILTDVVMPEMSGADLVRALRTSSPSTKILVMSGRIDGYALRAMTSPKALGAHGSIEKPFTSDRLVSKVAQVLG